jgi:twitching motility protein PilT
MVQGQPIDTHISLDHEPELNKYFKAAIKAKASDLHMKVGQVPKLRMHGSLKNTTGEMMTEEKMEQLIFEIMSPAQKDYFLKNGALDFAHEVTDVDRFRINVFRQRGMMSLAARRISSIIPPFETLHLPPVIERISQTHEGLVLVTGPTGSGKTTTIASMIDYINTNHQCHIVTIEDPIEYLFKDKKAIVSQREIGIDVPNFEDALRSLMRQDPDIVLVGEMRDNATITAAMRAAETGHMVFGTLHSANAPQTIQRLLDLFPQEERDLARQTFSLTCRAIISQQLLPSIKEGVSRIPAVEILIANPIVKKLIAEGREADLSSVMRACVNEGMQDFTESLCQLVNKEYIDLKIAKEYAPNKEELAMALKGIRSATSGIL